MRTGLSGLYIVIDADGVYHLRCWVRFKKRKGPMSSSRSLEKTLYQKKFVTFPYGRIYDMIDAGQRYMDVSDSRGTLISQIYVSRRKTFHDSVKATLLEKSRFVRSLTKTFLFFKVKKQNVY